MLAKALLLFVDEKFMGNNTHCAINTHTLSNI